MFVEELKHRRLGYLAYKRIKKKRISRNGLQIDKLQEAVWKI